MTVAKNITLALKEQKISKSEIADRLKNALEMVQLTGYAERYPSELSGGQQQRVAVARALINNPSVILADEPSGNLDSESAKNLHELFFKLRDKFGQTFILVTHNEELAEMTDRKLTMIDGKIV